MNRQRGSIVLYGIIALFIISLGGGIVYTYTSAIARAEKAEQDKKAWEDAAIKLKSENDQLREDKAKVDKALAKRQGARNAADEIERRINAKLSEAFKDPAVQEWAATRVPQPVIDSMRDSTATATGKGGDISPSGKSAAKTGG